MAKDYTHSVNLILARIDKSRQLPANKKLIREFLDHLIAVGNGNGGPIADSSLNRHAWCYEKVINAYGNKKPLLSATRQDIENAAANIRKLGLGSTPKIFLTLKMIFKWKKGEDYFMPKEVAWLSTKETTKRSLDNSMLLTTQQRMQIISSCLNLRSRAAIALMIDCGLRPHEVTKAKRRNLFLDVEEPYFDVPVDTKTKSRQVPLTLSQPMLKAWCNENRDMKPDDWLFYDIRGSNKERTIQHTKEPMTYGALHNEFKKAWKRAGIKDKPSYLYIVRHTRLNELFGNENISYAEAQYTAGHSFGSRSSQVYIHLNKKQAFAGIRKAAGLEQAAERKEVHPVVVQCPRCKAPCLPGQLYCTNSECGYPLDESIVIRNRELQKTALMDAIKEDPIFINNLFDKYIDKKLSKRKK